MTSCAWHAEIIHNPAVNQRLKEMDITIIKEDAGVKDFSHVKPNDVVILPAFGASLQEMMLLSDRGVNIVDTTCPWVAKVPALLRGLSVVVRFRPVLHL